MALYDQRKLLPERGSALLGHTSGRIFFVEPTVCGTREASRALDAPKKVQELDVVVWSGFRVLVNSLKGARLCLIS